jgi:hypothetical protein
MAQRHGPDVAALLERTGAARIAYRGFGNPPLRRPSGHADAAPLPAAQVAPASVPEPAVAPAPVVTLVAPPPPAAPAGLPPVALPLIEAALSVAGPAARPDAGVSTLARLRAAAG